MLQCLFPGDLKHLKFKLSKLPRYSLTFLSHKVCSILRLYKPYLNKLILNLLLLLMQTLTCGFYFVAQDDIIFFWPFQANMPSQFILSSFYNCCTNHSIIFMWLTIISHAFQCIYSILQNLCIIAVHIRKKEKENTLTCHKVINTIIKTFCANSSNFV